jgi:hypothetical protein
MSEKPNSTPVQGRENGHYGTLGLNSLWMSLFIPASNKTGEVVGSWGDSQMPCPTSKRRFPSRNDAPKSRENLKTQVQAHLNWTPRKSDHECARVQG